MLVDHGFSYPRSFATAEAQTRGPVTQSSFRNFVWRKRFNLETISGADTRSSGSESHLVWGGKVLVDTSFTLQQLDM